MNPVEDFIYQQEESVKEIMLYLHDLMLSRDLRPKISFRIPMYYGKSWICYLNPLKKGGLELAFCRGNELANASGILEDKGRKQIMGVSFQELRDINETAVLEILDEAILLDETVKYASKRKRKKS